MKKQFWIMPVNEVRRHAWDELVGSDRLPILQPKPRPGVIGPVYDVDVSQLGLTALSRLASYVARQNREDYKAVYDRMRIEGVAVPAVGTILLDDETAVFSASIRETALA